MDPRRDEDQSTAAAEQALAAISCEACPPVADALTAVASAWRPLDRAELDGEEDATPELVRRHCAHELAYVVLTGLAERLTGPRDAARARKLRERLALQSPPEHPGRALLGALWSESGDPR